MPEKCDRVIERILVEPKNVGTALSVVLDEAKSAKLFDIKSGNPSTLTIPTPASFLTVVVIIATQINANQIKLKCIDNERFHLDGKLNTNIAEYGLVIKPDLTKDGVLYLEQTDEWNTIKDEWIITSPPIL